MSGIEPTHLLEYVIRPTLRELGRSESRLNSPSAERLLLFTAAHESDLGRWLVQRNNGPAKGIYQMEQPAALDAFNRYKLMTGKDLHPYARTWDLKVATILARLYYWLAPAHLPDYLDEEGLAEYWHTYWCRGCQGTVSTALQQYRLGVLAKIGDWNRVV